MIRDAKNSKAIGPDGIATVMLKHLGEHGINYLTITFNICLQSLEIMRILHNDLVMKPNKFKLVQQQKLRQLTIRSVCILQIGLKIIWQTMVNFTEKLFPPYRLR